jgi:hypothetical protein
MPQILPPYDGVGDGTICRRSVGPLSGIGQVMLECLDHP